MTPILLALSAALAAPCPEPTTTVDLLAALTTADSAFISMDLGAFESARSEAHEALRCLDEPLSAVDAAWLHRVEALAAFVHEDGVLARRAFQSSLSIQPAYRLPERIAPPGNPLQELYAEASDLPPSAMEPLTPPKKISLYVDGTPADLRPTERPYVLQGIQDRGTIEGTTWLAGADPLPDWALGPLEPPPKLTDHKHRLRVPFLVAGGATLVGSGVSYGVALATHSKYMDPDTPYEDLDALRKRSNDATIAAGVLAGVGVGLGTVGLVIPW